MSLGEYKKKRNLSSSKEPPATGGKTISKKLISREQKLKGKVKRRKPIRLSRYLIHEHHASHLHYDLRLEMNGVLKSWAVPKVPPTVKNIKRLAIQVEDHPIAYAKFHGIIPEGNYGAGKVLIWDSGKYELIEKDSKKIIVDIHGKKLKGKYALIKTSYGGKKNGWLFFKL
jgi:DNA ligase D-like protein (predicted 3'-phosphoesterase)